MAKNALKKLERVAPYVPSSEDPRQELRRLVLQHKALTKAATALHNMSVHKKSTGKGGRAKGEVIKCRLPEDVMLDLQDTAKRNTKRADALRAAMLREMRKLPIYTLFLRHVFGVGDTGSVIAAYLVAEIDIHRCIKPSALRRFCGMMVCAGRLERAARGQKNAFCGELRMRLFQLASVWWKGRAIVTEARPHGTTSKYIEIWENYRHGAWQSGRVIDFALDKNGNRSGKIVTGAGQTVSAAGFIHSTGWHKAMDVFLSDLYTVWRAIEGLPVWPTYVEWVTGYKHGGEPSYQLPRGLNEPRLLSVEQALAEVGFVSAKARIAPVQDDEPDLLIEEDDEEAAE